MRGCGMRRSVLDADADAVLRAIEIAGGRRCRRERGEGERAGVQAVAAGDVGEPGAGV